MTDEPERAHGADDAEDADDAAGQGGAGRRTDWERRRRLAEIFGEVLPESTGDDRDESAAERGTGSDAWLRDQVPPHHGD